MSETLETLETFGILEILNAAKAKADIWKTGTMSPMDPDKTALDHIFKEKTEIYSKANYLLGYAGSLDNAIRIVRLDLDANY